MSATKIEILALSPDSVLINLHSRVIKGHQRGKLHPADLLQIIKDNHKALVVHDDVAEEIIKVWTPG